MFSADAADLIELKHLLDAFTRAYAQRDLRALEALVSHMPPTVVYHVLPTMQLYDARDTLTMQALSDWAQYDASAIVFTGVAASIVGCVSWLSADCNFHLLANGRSTVLLGRFESILRRCGDCWLICQQRFFLATPWSENPCIFPN